MGEPAYDGFRVRCPHCNELAVGPLSRAEFAEWLKLCDALMVADVIRPVPGLAVKGGDG